MVGVNTPGPCWTKTLKSLEPPPFSISRTFRAPPLMPENISVPPLNIFIPPLGIINVLSLKKLDGFFVFYKWTTYDMTYCGQLPVSGMVGGGRAWPPSDGHQGHRSASDRYMPSLPNYSLVYAHYA